MKKSIKLTKKFTVSPETLYHAWLDSREHTMMTGGEAICSNDLGGHFSTWDGYITGHNKSLTENKEIVQSWRTTEFSASDEDSLLTIQFAAIKEGSLLTLIHEQIPNDQSDYEKGWIEHYFTPMEEYFKK